MEFAEKTTIPQSGICLVSLSANSDHQNTLYGMFSALFGKFIVHTVGINNPIVDKPPMTKFNHYVKCPERPGISKGTFDLTSIYRIVRIIKDSGCKTIYFESVHVWNCAIMLGLGRGYTKITTLHDVVPHDGAKSVLLCQKAQSLLSDYVVIKSPEFIDAAERLYGLKESKLIVFGVWRDYPRFSYHKGDGSYLFFGRLRRYKGLENVLVLAEKCRDINFKVVGSPDEQSMPIVERLASLPNTEVIARKVSDDEMANFFETSSWVILPYQSASQSGVIIDAYKYGRPVIAYGVGAISSQVNDGSSGLLVRPDALDDFVSSIYLTKNLDSHKYREMCENAYAFGYKHYSTDVLSKEFAIKFNIDKVVDK